MIWWVGGNDRSEYTPYKIRDEITKNRSFGLLTVGLAYEMSVSDLRETHLIKRHASI